MNVEGVQGDLWSYLCKTSGIQLYVGLSRFPSLVNLSTFNTRPVCWIRGIIADSSVFVELFFLSPGPVLHVFVHVVSSQRRCGGAGGPQNLWPPRTARCCDLRGCRRLRSTLLLLNILMMQTWPLIFILISQLCLVLLHSAQVCCSDGPEGAEIPAV